MSLKSRLEIGRLLKQGRRFSGISFSLIWQPAEQFRYAVLISRRHGSAAYRNRLKRLFREAIRLSLQNLTIRGSMLILPSMSDQEPPFEQIRSEISRIFREISAG